MLNDLQSPPAAAPAGEAAPHPPALPTDEPSMVARAQDVLVLLSGPQMQLESVRVRPLPSPQACHQLAQHQAALIAGVRGVEGRCAVERRVSWRWAAAICWDGRGGADDRDE